MRVIIANWADPALDHRCLAKHFQFATSVRNFRIFYYYTH